MIDCRERKLSLPVAARAVRSRLRVLLEETRAVLRPHDRPEKHRRNLREHRKDPRGGGPKFTSSLKVGTHERPVDVDQDSFRHPPQRSLTHALASSILSGAATGPSNDFVF